MPTYTYRCPAGHILEVERPVDNRNTPERCVLHNADAPRLYTVPQMIVRPWGFSLRPGDKGYWSFEDSRPGPSLAPFAMEEDRIKNPATLAED